MLVATRSPQTSTEGRLRRYLSGVPERPDELSSRDADALRAENVSLRVELERVETELARALEELAAQDADARRRLAALERSAALRVQRRLSRAGRDLKRLVAPPAPQSDDARDPEVVSVPIAALRADLDHGWPSGARWRANVRVGATIATVLEQPCGTTVRYRLKLPPKSTVRLGVGLAARVWREASASAIVSVALEQPDGQILVRREEPLRVALDGGAWEPVRMELSSVAGGEVWLSLGAAADATVFPVPHVLWVAPEIVFAPGRRTLLAPVITEPSAPERLAQRDGDAEGPSRPLISLLTPVHDPEPRLLRELLRSVQDQKFGDWELCLVNDGGADSTVAAILEEAAALDERVHLRSRSENGGISSATNEALAMARGEYVAFLDHDDRLADDALAVVATRLARNPQIDVLYTDEDHITHVDQRFRPLRKPDWSPDSLRSQMYTGHLGVIRRALADELGGLRSEFDGSQDYDLILRASERTGRIAHLDCVLYHWRVIPSSAAIGVTAKPFAYEAARRALQAHSDRLELGASVVADERAGTYRLIYEVDPATSVDIILTLSPADDLQRLPEVLDRGGLRSWRLFVDGEDPVCRLAWSTLAALDIEPSVIPGSSGAKTPLPHDASGRLVLFLEAAPADATDGWLMALAGHALRDGVGAVGAKVLADDRRLEHGGVVIGSGLPLPVSHGADAEAPGHLSTLVTTVNRSAVDGAVMARRDVLDAVGWPDRAPGRAARGLLSPG